MDKSQINAVKMNCATDYYYYYFMNSQLIFEILNIKIYI